jgi:hypothetical protein
MASRARGGAKPGEPTPEELAKANKKGEKDQKRIEKKLRQTELTDNIKMSYQTIRPTIIQAQRILKILDTLKIKFQISQLLNFEFVKHFESDETMEASKLEPSKIAKLSKPTLSCLAKIAGLQRKMHDLLSQEAVQESQVGEEEQDDSRRDEDLDDEDNQEARERRAKEEAEKERIRQERESQVMYLKEKMEGDFNNLVRQLERDQTELAVIRVTTWVNSRASIRRATRQSISWTRSTHWRASK